MDPFKILGIRPTATRREVEAAYREKALKHHPDRGGDAWAFEQVNWAYQEALRLLGADGNQRFDQEPKSTELKQRSPSPRSRASNSHNQDAAGKSGKASTTSQPEARPSPTKGRKLSRREWTNTSLGTGILIACYFIFKLYTTFFRPEPMERFRIKR